MVIRDRHVNYYSLHNGRETSFIICRGCPCYVNAVTAVRPSDSALLFIMQVLFANPRS
jgi:hypothetical protein